MPKRVKVFGPATPEEIADAYQKCTSPHDYSRLVAQKMAQQGEWTLKQIGKALGKDSTTIVRWMKAYRQGGLQGLLVRGHGGRLPRLKKEDIEPSK